MYNDAISLEYMKYNDYKDEDVVCSLYKLPARHSHTISCWDFGKSFRHSIYLSRHQAKALDGMEKITKEMEILFCDFLCLYYLHLIVWVSLSVVS